ARRWAFCRGSWTRSRRSDLLWLPRACSSSCRAATFSGTRPSAGMPTRSRSWGGPLHGASTSAAPGFAIHDALGTPAMIGGLALLIYSYLIMHELPLRQVTTTAMGDGILWEAPPAGMRTYGTAATANPPSPLPYPGTVPRLPTQQHPQHLQGFFGNGSGGFGIWGSAVRGRDEHQPGCLATANDWCEVVQVGTQLGGDGAGVDMKEPVF
ncbi:hypothetical protein Vretifemale_1110, partial [Volvox reticuliferus]